VGTGRRAIVAVIASLLLALAAMPAASSGAGPTPIPQRYCRSVHAQGQQWGVDGTGPRCPFMRRWTLRWLNQRQHPKGWTCVDLGEGGQCDKRHSPAYFEYYVFD
jgi:hypothetical protein